MKKPIVAIGIVFSMILILTVVLRFKLGTKASDNVSGIRKNLESELVADFDNSNEQSATIEQLRKQVKQKDRLITQLTLGNRLIENRNRRVDDPPDELTNVELAIQALDSRLTVGNPNTEEARFYQDELTAVIDNEVLGVTELVSLHCGDELCRAILFNENRRELETTTEKLARKSGKILGSLNAFDTSDGEKLVYMAKDSKSLQVESPGEGAPYPSDDASDGVRHTDVKI